MKRSRSNDGQRTHVEARVPVRSSLVYAVLGTPAPLERKAPRIFHGPKTPRGHPAPVLTDEQVLRIRALEKFHGMTAKQIADATGVELERVKQVLLLVNRVHLDPKPMDACAKL